MNRRFAWPLALLLIPHAFAAKADDYPAPVAEIALEDGETLVFLGDSITHQCLYTQYIEDYFYTRYPQKRFRFHNSGVGGDVNRDALDRFDDDVAKFKPKYVTVLLGMNDGRYQPYNQEIFETYEKDMLELIERIQDIGAVPVLMTPTMYDSRAARIADRGDDFRNTHYNATLAYFGSRIREMAIDGGLGFVDMYSPLNILTMQQRKEDPKFTLIADAVHPGADGQVVMATAVLDQMHPNRVVSTIHVNIGREGYPRANATGGKIVGVTHDSNRTAFSFQAEALPWVLPEEAAKGYQLTRAGHRFSREQLRVNGLPPGRYQIRIDGEAVGNYSDVQLSRGIELQANAKTPQYKQALEVATLNKARNDDAYRPIRNLWRDKKIQRRLQRQAEASPDDENAATQLAAMNERLEDFDSKVEALLAKAAEFEDRIYEANQPVERTYEVVKAPEPRRGAGKGKATKKKAQ